MQGGGGRCRGRRGWISVSQVKREKVLIAFYLLPTTTFQMKKYFYVVKSFDLLLN